MPLILWIIYLIISLLLTVLVMTLVKLIQAAWNRRNGNTLATNVFDSPVVCMLVDALVWLISGAFVNIYDFPVWKVFIFIIIYELVSQCFLSYWFPTCYNAGWLKSVLDILVSISAFWLGTFLQKRSLKHGVQAGAAAQRKIKGKLEVIC